jgi:hypothetical protein
MNEEDGAETTLAAHIRTEQQRLQEAYKSLKQLCSIMKYSDKVKATAIIYLQRFYLYAKITDYDLKSMM